MKTPLQDFPAEESPLWLGRPAPRCFTLRNWRHSLIGMVLALPVGVWQQFGIDLVREGAPVVTAWFPVPFAAAVLYLAVGHVLIARIGWESTFYALGEKGVYRQHGIRRTFRHLPFEAIREIIIRAHGPFVATIVLKTDDGKMLLNCLEHSEELLKLLAEKTGIEPRRIP